MIRRNMSKMSTTRRVIRVFLLNDLFGVRRPDVARALHISESALDDRLHKEGASYRDLLNRVRLHRLKPRRGEFKEATVADVARTLGFASRQSFYRWYNSQTGECWGERKAA